MPGLLVDPAASALLAVHDCRLVNYYGLFYRSELIRSLDLIHECRVRMGHAEIQAVTQTSPTGAQALGSSHNATARPLRPLGG